MIAVSILEIGERLCFFVWQQAAKQKNIGVAKAT